MTSTVTRRGGGWLREMTLNCGWLQMVADGGQGGGGGGGEVSALNVDVHKKIFYIYITF